jgi:lipoate-protein ligase A
MRCFISDSNDPYFNLATEEYLLKNYSDDILMFYINEPCIVIGKHQNLLSEINLPFTIENNIKLARRISGGGTVYQDSNNINFSFIQKNSNIERINFEIFIAPIINTLNSLGLNAYFSERHDILIDDKKVSGNAMHVYRNRVLSHGTLLYNSDLNHLSLALKNRPEKYADKSIKSVKSKVANINIYLNSDLSTLEFCQLLLKAIMSDVDLNTNLNLEEIKNINKLSNEKFKSWDWTYGYSPPYYFRNTMSLIDQEIEITLEVNKGIIINIELNSTCETKDHYKNFFDSLIGIKHEYQSILRLLNNHISKNLLIPIELSQLSRLLF